MAVGPPKGVASKLAETTVPFSNVTEYSTSIGVVPPKLEHNGCEMFPGKSAHNFSRSPSCISNGP